MVAEKYVLMLGTDPKGKGGIASVVSVYIQCGLFENFPVRYVVTHREGGGVAKLWRAGFTVFKVIALLLTGKVALVHAHVSSNGSFKRKSVYLALARLFSVPTIFHLHSGEFHRFVDEGVSSLTRRWIVYTVSNATRVIALSDAWANYLRKLSPSAGVCVIANPVKLPAPSNIDNTKPGRLLFLGRAGERKGVFVLLEAVALLRARFPWVRLALGGDGDLDQVRAVATDLGIVDLIEILGWVGAEEKRCQFAYAQVFVLPSFHEGLPMAMLEAMAHAKPVVVTPVGGIPEAVQDGQQGLLVPAGDAPALAAALSRLLEDAPLRESMGRSAQCRVAERYSTDIVIDHVSALYEDLGVEREASNAMGATSTSGFHK